MNETAYSALRSTSNSVTGSTGLSARIQDVLNQLHKKRDDEKKFEAARTTRRLDESSQRIRDKGIIVVDESNSALPPISNKQSNH